MSVVIPTLNEAANLPAVFLRLRDEWEIVVVDGHSSDGTVALARLLRPDARIVLQSGRGKGNALAEGLAAASGDVVVTLDADGSADPAEIPRFLAALEGGADYAKGSRFLDGGGSDDLTLLRSAGNRVLRLLVNLLFRTKYTDLCYGYNAFWRWVVPYLDLDCDGFEIETLMNIRVARCGLNVAEVPSVEAPRLNGTSNLHVVRDGIRIVRTILRERLTGGWCVRRAPLLERELAVAASGRSRLLATTRPPVPSRRRA